MTHEELKPFVERIQLELLGGLISTPNLTRLVTPEADSGLEWKSVSFRLTLGWTDEGRFMS